MIQNQAYQNVVDNEEIVRQITKLCSYTSTISSKGSEA